MQCFGLFFDLEVQRELDTGVAGPGCVELVAKRGDGAGGGVVPIQRLKGEGLVAHRVSDRTVAAAPHRLRPGTGRDQRRLLQRSRRRVGQGPQGRPRPG